jgi:hypothetical protein
MTRQNVAQSEKPWDMPDDIFDDMPEAGTSGNHCTEILADYPPAFNSVNTCLAISFSVSKTPVP